MRLRKLIICLVTGLVLHIPAHAHEIRIPAFTAYLDPDTQAARVDANGITGWASHDTIIWGGSLSPGQVNAVVIVKLPVGSSSTLKLSIAGQSRTAAIVGASDAVSAEFGPFTVAAAGYQRIELAGVDKSGSTFGDISELSLSGPAVKDAFFNLKARRNAASVHLHYPVEKGAGIAWFYNELTPRTDPVATYYEACGFSRGYFGIQMNSPTERRVIFSVWDAGHEPVDRGKVREEDRVKLLAAGDGVIAHDFGNEGTGGHSHLVYPWKTGETQRFLVTAKIDGDATIYTGYFYFNDTKKWALIASFRAPHDGKLLRGLYSFNENFSGSNGHLRRLCEFANQWIKTTDGKWTELLAAQFTHDPTGGNDRRDFGAGVSKDGRFYLSNGGFISEPVKQNDTFTRPTMGHPPGDIVLPEERGK